MTTGIQPAVLCGIATVIATDVMDSRWGAAYGYAAQQRHTGGALSTSQRRG
jgi:hypothetical protein